MILNFKMLWSVRVQVLVVAVLASSSLVVTPTDAQAEETGIRVQFAESGKPVETLDLLASEYSNEDGSREVVLKPADSDSDSDSKNPAKPAAQALEIPTLIISLDMGATWISKNTVRVPNSGGSTFSLTPQDPSTTFRIYLSWLINKNHSLRLLFAPLDRTAEITSTTDLAFNGLSFLAGQPIDARYKFNSYRLSYIYQFDPIGDLVFRVGFSAKIRDAQIALRQGNLATASTDLGFVPLLHLGARYSFLKHWFADLELEGLAAPGAPGRAFDGAALLGYQMPDYSIALGYRFIEGGADVAQVYNFAFINTLFGRIAVNF